MLGPTRLSIASSLRGRIETPARDASGVYLTGSWPVSRSSGWRAGTSTARSDFTETFLDTYASKAFDEKERRLFRKALRLLDQDGKHPSLRVHKLHGDQDGSWSASASEELRMTFERLAGGRKRLLTCSRHYGD